MLSPSLEDYLEEIYRLSLMNYRIRIRDIADRLSVSSPSVVKALKKLNEESYIDYKPYKEITLTDKGKVLGNLLVRRNSMLQEFLKVIGSKCDIERESEAMEHYLSSSTILAIENLIEFMKLEQIQSLYLKFNKDSNQKHWSKGIE